MLQLDDILRELERKEQAKRSLTSFAEYILSRPPYLHQKEFLTLQSRIKVWCSPPTSGKTTYGAVIPAAWHLGTHPNSRILIVSFSADAARHVSKKLLHVVNDPKYSALFETSPPSDTSAQNWSTSTGEVKAIGVGTPLFGFEPTLVIIDEPIDRRSADATHPSKLKQLQTWLRTDVLPNSKGELILVCHRTSNLDLAAFLSKKTTPLIHKADSIEGMDPETLEDAQTDPIRWKTWYLQNPPSLDCVQDLLDEIPYVPREVFKPYHQSSARYSITVAHRRAGKTVARTNKLIRAAILCDKPNPRYAYLAPFFVQAKDIAWTYLKHYAGAILAEGGKVNESDLSVTFGHNGAQIRLYGADNADRLRGLYFDGVVADEAQDIAPSTLTQIIIPALSDRQGFLDLSGTPKGWGNLLGTAYKTAQQDPTWFCQELKASATGIIPEEELALMKRMMPENEYDQELECSFEAAITGAYFAKEMTDAKASGRITSVPYDKALMVHTAWDLGISDSMVIWFFQQIGREVRIIDVYAANGHGLDHYARVLRDKKYNYGDHHGPHDVMVRELGTGKSRKETALELGIEFTPVPKLSVKDGIDAARLLISRCWFDEVKTATGMDALKQYQERLDRKTGVSMGPLHNWCSNYADAFRMLAVAIQDPQPKKLELAFDHGYAVGGWMG